MLAEVLSWVQSNIIAAAGGFLAFLLLLANAWHNFQVRRSLRLIEKNTRRVL